MFIFISCLVVIRGISIAEAISCGDMKISIAEGHLTKLTKISRYFVYTNEVPFDSATNYMEAKKICLAGGFSIADVQSEVDLESLKKFIVESQSQGSYWIGMNDIEREGHFVDGDGESIEFQAFRQGSPNGGEDENCVQLSLSSNSSRFIIMEDEDCLSTAGVLCQYHSKSFCHINSFQDEIQLPDIGKSNVTQFLQMYISRSQATRDQALEECIIHNGRLLSINDYDIAVQLKPIVEKYHNSSNRNPETSYWISGSLYKSEEIYPDYDSPVTLDNFIDLHKSNGPCAEISFIANPDFNSTTPEIRPAICTLPKYYICIGEQLVDIELDESEIDNLLQDLIRTA